MTSVAVTTIVRMVESLPEPTQEKVAEHLREYLADMKDEQEWDKQWKDSHEQLTSVGRKVKQQIQAQQSEPMDMNRL